LKEHISKIDHVRGIAILLVFLYHAQIVLFPNYSRDEGVLSAILRELPSAHGGTGVQLFLLISGFLIHYGTLSRGNEFNIKRFYSRRFWRIYPPFLVILSFFICFKTGTDVTNLITHITLTYNLFDQYIFQVNPSFWSLALEFQLYLIYPIYLLLYKKLGNNYSAIVILLISIVFVLIKIAINTESSAFDFFVLKYWIMWVSGAFLAHKFYYGQRITQLKGSGIFLCLIFLMFVIRIDFFSEWYFYLFSLFYLLFLDWYLNTPLELNNFFGIILKRLGIVSYSFYLIHQPFIWELINQLNFGFYSFLIAIPLVGFFYYLISELLYRFIELPSIKMGEITYVKLYNKQ
jgi:peptidoglycan/LPS O-acetylase OafA/YrhL